ncbi:MAG TPA: dihydroorotase [Elusimicrobia bacterium]|nr:MAG: dihydroorotase [Elusimicrobia bacterium RIFOXYA12_FULL_49_49]OGS09531.1 MAG: dihydroorotase [Elusimicrobia bacterium RIFOXYA1_FULL_47_7]OGS15492.1 MAG: dihydroorotase [Elusimicrobia bacterium RIFOXYA2_FULL_47_53]OGS26987.1 MAG: dihydroorotase [Elusimicrobia bacterium RIFOXYB12_FULL_50_12]OGS30932.1 MAG: dihydroorotase [Elusimicrobia bacterium RIFOXYB2_FULL_46_23]HBU70118.1 dihydroorotase [Elusimicrobiota bacterium]
MKILISGGRVIDPAFKSDKKMDLLISDGVIERVADKITDKADTKIDARGKIVAPGLIDIHTHLREPGHEEEETIASGTRAAAKGGYTSIFCMPNTHPPLDNAPAVEFVLMKAQKEGLINVFPIGCITKESAGVELAEIGVLKSAGVIAISDDGNPVMDSQVMRHALEYTKMFSLPVISHAEDKNLSKNGVMNEGGVSTVLGLRGIPNQSEDIMVSRDIMLAELTGGHLHVAHVSTEGSVDLIRRAKKNKIKVTAETCPHYFTLTDEAVKNYDTNTKMKPPLRAQRDVEAIIKGLSDGTIDCIASDHAPHTEEEKNKEYDLAPFGIIGLESTLSLVIMDLIDKKILSWPQAICLMSGNPASIFGLNGRGKIKSGCVADIVVIDPLKEFVLTKNSILSKSKNSPYIGKKMKGAAEYTIAGGKIVWSEKEGINQ